MPPLALSVFRLILHFDYLPRFTLVVFCQLLGFSHIKFLNRRLILVGSIQNFGSSPACFLYLLFVFRTILP